jgi:hypothetical protein
MNERTTVRLPSELLSRAKHQAAAEGRTVTALIEEGLRLVMAERAEEPARQILPPVWKATSGAAPEIDLHALQEIEDLEYVERMKHFK